MNVSRIFIDRPIGTTLLAIGLFLMGLVAYVKLPVAATLAAIVSGSARSPASRK